MKLGFKVESVLITVTAVLFAIILFNLCRKLRSILPFRVNCWFCNQNLWVKLPERNCWTCPYCEQYNGFTKDGDYNRPFITSSGVNHETKSVFGRTPPKNGLCKMCNINQQLKVTQLANFIPMNEKHFDDEVEAYCLQLEKAYKLCSPCKKVLEKKLFKEKETFLGSKLLQARTPALHKIVEKQNKKSSNVICSSMVLITGILMILICIDCYKQTVKYDKIHILSQGKELMTSFVERLTSIIKMKALWTFPELESYAHIFHSNYSNTLNTLSKHFSQEFDNEIAQIILGLLGCLVQITQHVLESDLKHAFTTDVLWLMFMAISLGQHSVDLSLVITSIVKLFCVASVFIIYVNMKVTSSSRPTTLITTPKKMKNVNNGTNRSIASIEDSSCDETDDDVSLSKFGVHNFSDSSNENIHPMNNTLINGRSFTPRSSDNLWTKPKNNSTFCVTKTLNKLSNINDNIFIKPTFNNYQKVIKDESDSDLDESISCLSIGSPKKKTENSNSIFSLRKFNATPNFIAPTVMPLSQRRPLISPSKLGHGTSWVAGGYWGGEGNRQIFTVNGSRSSSQSSGFESQTSSLNQRNVFSQPPSREESICGEPDGPNILLDRFHNCNVNNFGTVCNNPQNFGCPNAPVYPQMRYDSHVHIPQARFAPQNQSNAYMNYSQHQFVQNGTFKTPGRSGLIKLPQVHSMSH